MVERLHKKVAIITGAARGIGRAAALLFAQEGAVVVVADLDEVKGEETAFLIRSKGGQAEFYKTNLIESDQVANLVDNTFKKFGRIDILYNNAGINHFAKVTDTTEADWDKVMQVNVKSVFLTCKYALQIMSSRVTE